MHLPKAFTRQRVDAHDAALPCTIAHYEARRRHPLDEPVGRRNRITFKHEDVRSGGARGCSAVGIMKGYGSRGIKRGDPGAFLAVGDVYDFFVRFE